MLPDHAAVFFAWPITAPLSAAYVGASFWAAGVLIFWASRQRHWVRARVTIPAIAVVVSTLLAATLRHLELFSSPLGLVWVEVYVLVGPVAVVLLALQLGVPGTDPHSGRALPGWLRGGLAIQAGALLAAGGLLFLAPGTAADVWPWPLTELTSMAIGGWMLGVAVTAVYLVWHDDRDDIARRAAGERRARRLPPGRARAAPWPARRRRPGPVGVRGRLPGRARARARRRARGASGRRLRRHACAGRDPGRAGRQRSGSAAERRTAPRAARCSR